MKPRWGWPRKGALDTALLQLSKAQDGDVLVIRFRPPATMDDALKFRNALMEMEGGPETGHALLVIAQDGVDWELQRK